MGQPRFADVALPVPVDHPFTYAVPEALADHVILGMRVVVPVRKRTETGYVVGLRDTTDVPNVRAIIDVPDPAPVFSALMLRLCTWLADYYCCSLGEALQCTLPAGLKTQAIVRYTLLPDQLGTGRYSERQRKVVAELYSRGSRTQKQLAATLGSAGLTQSLQSLVARGILRAETTGHEQGVSMRTETYVRLIEANVPDTEDLARLQRRAPKQAAVYLDLLHGEPERAASALYAKHQANAAIVNALTAKALVERVEREFLRTPEFRADPNSRVKLALNPEQQHAYESIVNAAAADAFTTFLLRGVTGSGKTEVYLQAIEHVLELGRNAILLVPEISLTPQTVGRLFGRFQERIAVLHSGLGRGERYDEWRRAQRGEVRIVVGARSAVFAPLPNVGIIVVDEEHDGSYKQSDAPRYHARDVAIMRASLEKAVCVLGSATPSIESNFKSEAAKFTRLELPNRATRGTLPEVRLVDMRVETKEVGGEVVLSRLLEAEIRARVAAKEQVILLLNRRGFAPFVLCAKCGWVAHCEHCNVSLTYHASGGHLCCHYCGTRSGVPEECGECGFSPLLFLGTGTQKAEQFLMRAFDGARIERMDADTTSGKGGHAKILGRFANGDIDILLGTQMIAKGHDYPGVTLVGVINADTGLSIPDFRAAEQSFQLLTQVAGRAGRGDRPGTVIIQTFRPNHYAVQAASHHDYAAFYAREIAERRAAAYPPFRRMANLAIEAEDPQHAQRAAALLHRIVREQIQAHNFRGVEVLGPSPASVYRVKKKYRWNLGLLSKSAKRLNILTRATRDDLAQRAATSKIQLKVDLDPYGVF
ncbi:MAG: primosomal protein N' [Nitrospiraceae bacterium]|nr:primosomal protein N' [Nitrospiraceae bacterium]